MCRAQQQQSGRRSGLSRRSMLPFVWCSLRLLPGVGYQMKGRLWLESVLWMSKWHLLHSIDLLSWASHCTSAPDKAPFLLLLVRLRARAQQEDMLVLLCQHNCLWHYNYTKSSLSEGLQFRDFWKPKWGFHSEIDFLKNLCCCKASNWIWESLKGSKYGNGDIDSEQGNKGSAIRLAHQR